MDRITARLGSGLTTPSPLIDCWIPEENPSRSGLVILPGGGYQGLSKHEGEAYAERFAKAGLACFVVTYRLGSQGFRHPAMLEDALAAMGTIRRTAGAYGVDPGRIGIMGSSAGGHLAAHVLVAWSRYSSDVSLRPDFGILCYPVITAQGPFAHAGSILNLAGGHPSPDLLDQLSCEKHVDANTPPCFLWHTGEDAVVPMENSLLFAGALRKQGVPYEMHLYPEGRHGLGLSAPFDWVSDCLRWMKGVIKETPSCDDGSPNRSHE